MADNKECVPYYFSVEKKTNQASFSNEVKDDERKKNTKKVPLCITFWRSYER